MDEKKIGLSELTSIAIGGVIGAGAISLIGVAIGMTGHSAWLAYLVSVILGMIFCLPIGVMTSALRLDGGIYTLVGSILGKRSAGLYAAGLLFYFPCLAIYALSMGSYVNSLIPAVNQRVCAIVVITFFYAMNLTGAQLMAKVQKLMVVLLILALCFFILFGLFHINQPVFSFSASDFYMNGASGFWSSVFLLFYSVTGYYWVMFCGRHARNAYRNIPLSMLLAAVAILIVYPGIGIVASGVLPIENVANQPLTWVAEEIFPTAIFVVFMICGPFMALGTTINSLFIAYSEPIRDAAEDGWFGKFFAKTNKHGAAVGVITFIWIISIVPIILGLDISTITNSNMLIDYTLIFLMMFALLRVPKLLPEKWAERKIKVGTNMYYVMIVISMLIQVAVIVSAISSLTPLVLTASISIMVILFIYALLRDKSGKVNMKIKNFDE